MVLTYSYISVIVCTTYEKFGYLDSEKCEQKALWIIWHQLLCFGNFLLYTLCIQFKICRKGPQYSEEWSYSNTVNSPLSDLYKEWYLQISFNDDGALIEIFYILSKQNRCFLTLSFTYRWKASYTNEKSSIILSLCDSWNKCQLYIIRVRTHPPTNTHTHTFVHMCAQIFAS
jgi:hypothetical protein